MKITIINGPNLNLLGTREKDIYGSKRFEDYFLELKNEFKDIELDYFQSNIEGEIIDKLHNIGFSDNGIILNAGGYTHTSVSIADAIKSIETPVIEVHISNILTREPFRHVSLIAPNCKGSIFGFGLKGYKLAILSFLN
ncbi:MAG: aroQ [Bacteroidetes bacterium]|nr:aroQ [Bacteroidota bacterium]